MTTGKGRGAVVLLGGGPGDPGLITRRGLDCLRRAEVVIYDHLVTEQLLDEVPQSAELIFAGKQAGCASKTQEEINALLLEKAGQGSYVVRLKGGDPFVFGRGGEEALALVEAGIPFTVVPGVTSASAAAAYAGIPVTHRGLATSFEVVTGHPATGAVSMVDWGRVANGADTVAVYMGVGRMPEITRMLIDGGRAADTPAVVIRAGTTPEQVTVTGTVSDIAERSAAAGIKPPAILLVGRVTALHERLSWFENRPLFGLRLLVLRPENQSAELAEPLTDRGALVYRFPVMALDAPEDLEPLDRAIAELERFHWLLFSSPNGVRCFFRRLRELGRDARALGGLQVGVVGPGTARVLEDHGVTADVLPPRSYAEAFAGELARDGRMAGQRVLLPQARDARPVLGERLAQAGADVHAVEAYRMAPTGRPADRLRRQVDGGELDGLLFTSSSTVTGLLAALDRDDFTEIPAGCRLVSIGPVTSETIRRHGGTVAAEAEPHTIDGLVRCTESLLGRCTGTEKENQR